MGKETARPPKNGRIGTLSTQFFCLADFGPALFGVSDFWFVNDEIGGDDFVSLLIFQGGGGSSNKHKQIEINNLLFSFETNSSERNLNNKNPSQEISPGREKNKPRQV